MVVFFVWWCLLVAVFLWSFVLGAFVCRVLPGAVGALFWCCFGVLFSFWAFLVRVKRREGTGQVRNANNKKVKQRVDAKHAFNGNGVLLLQLIKTYTKLALTAHSARFSARDM